MSKLKHLFTLVSFILISTSTFPNVSENIDLEGDKSVQLSGSINPISGDMVVDEVDLVVPGIEPIEVRRTYSSGSQKGPQPYWQYFPQTYMYIDTNVYGKKEQRVSVCEPSGMLVKYKNHVCQKATGSGKDRYTFVPMLGKEAKGITNTARGSIGANTNIQNNTIKWIRHEGLYILTACDGTKKYYRKHKKNLALLRKERKPNGNWVFYQYDDTLQEALITIKS